MKNAPDTAAKKTARIMYVCESKWLDYIESSAKANARAAAAEAEVERLRAALRPFAKAASDYERQGEFFSNNIELVLRVSVFAAPEYHNSTAVQVGDLRRARSALEGRDNG